VSSRYHWTRQQNCPTITEIDRRRPPPPTPEHRWFCHHDSVLTKPFPSRQAHQFRSPISEPRWQTSRCLLGVASVRFLYNFFFFRVLRELPTGQWQPSIHCSAIITREWRCITNLLEVGATAMLTSTCAQQGSPYICRRRGRRNGRQRLPAPGAWTSSLTPRPLTGAPSLTKGRTTTGCNPFSAHGMARLSHAPL
jgi:hypothetical protein